ncbi:MAG: S41 family peptidase [Candidatus Bipolaricaulota bacterium]|nr:S41 family peptidase [Candidatus Bipolaricaulota bacterium]MDW8126252.1 S41 family peptidase [Candidatus Bipolaricaulota bacterium]
MRKFLIVLALLGVLGFGAGQVTDIFQPLSQVYDVIRHYYLWADQVTDTQLIQGAIRGMVQSLGDPYSTYFTPEEYEEWQRSLAGEYTGVGIEITIRKGWITVVTPLPDTPAEKAGIQPGDVILEVDGESTEGWTLEQASMHIRGPEGTPVTLKVRHPDGKVETLTIVRARIKVEAVRSEYLAENKVGYVRVLRFDEEAPALVGRALFSFPLEEVRGVVLDLRSNPGGLLSSAVEVASYFIDRGPIVRTRGPSFGERLYNSRGNSFPNVPVAVLVNEGTASGAEIVAGAIQDYKVGVLVGRKTFGKGLIQEIVLRFPDGGMLKLTTGEYLTPKGRQVHDVGLTPDIFVPEGKSDEEDLDLKAALEWLASQVPVGVGQ